MKIYRKKYLLYMVTSFFVLSVTFYSASYSQSCYNLLVDSVISRANNNSVSRFCRELSGDTSTLIGGQPITVWTRFTTSPFNTKAAQYIYEKFQSYGLQASYQVYSEFGANVIGKKTGIKYPNRQYIICGHFDVFVWDLPRDTIPGADDNASGVCAVLEAARILNQYNSDNTILFIAFDEEDYNVNGIWGSKAYADTARLHGDSILGVINLDMIGWDADNDGKFQITTNWNSQFLADLIVTGALAYVPALKPEKRVGPYGSDQDAFWSVNYKAVAIHEDLTDFNPYYHTVDDKYSWVNRNYMFSIVKSTIASLMVMDKDYIINFQHEPLLSSSDTSSREVTTLITSNHQIGSDGNAPRLYYKAGSEPFRFLLPFYNHLDTFKFLIPGEPFGKTISYYLSAQDSSGVIIGSLPAGARGVNPPGTQPPVNLFTYRILKQLSICSNTVPETLFTEQYFYDTIKVLQQGLIHDYNLNLTINHSNDSDLSVWLTKPGQALIELSTHNGGSGDNYINTAFGDGSKISIRRGTPPFTGLFTPEMPLSTFKNLPIQGDWILRIYNHSPEVAGEIVSWCLSFDYYDPIGIVNNQIPVKISLSQNYPNPFNSSTKINFTLLKQSHIKISVYDVLGREVRVLVNNLINYGEHSLSFDANNLASGLYFYSMYINGDLFVTKKMVLIK